MAVIDGLMQQRGAAGGLALLAHTVLDAHDVLRLKVLSVHVVGRDQEGAVREALGERALRAVEQALIVGAVNELAHIAARGALLAADLAGDERVQRRMSLGGVQIDLGLRQLVGRADLARVDFDAAAEVQRFKGHEGVEQILRAAANAVVFHHDGVIALGELAGEVFAQLFAAGHLVLGHGHLAADLRDAGHKAGVGDLAGEGERHQRRRMGVQYGVEVGAQSVNIAVEGQLDRGLVRADDLAVLCDAHDVIAGEAALVDAGGRDPDVAVGVADGQIAAGGGGHAILIDAVHDHDQLIGGMQKIKSHTFAS